MKEGQTNDDRGLRSRRQQPKPGSNLYQDLIGLLKLAVSVRRRKKEALNMSFV